MNFYIVNPRHPKAREALSHGRYAPDASDFSWIELLKPGLWAIGSLVFLILMAQSPGGREAIGAPILVGVIAWGYIIILLLLVRPEKVKVRKFRKYLRQGWVLEVSPQVEDALVKDLERLGINPNKHLDEALSSQFAETKALMMMVNDALRLMPESDAQSQKYLLDGIARQTAVIASNFKELYDARKAGEDQEKRMRRNAVRVRVE